MAKHRSPNCPQITFQEAIEKGRKVYEKEHTHSAVKEVVAQDLGYSSINGRSLSLIGALRQYGILEGSGDALRVSQDAIAFYEMDDGSERSAASQRMMFAPALFAELRQLFPEKLPSEGNLKHTLITKGFLPKAAEDVIRVYRANVELALKEENSYDERRIEDEQEVNQESKSGAGRARNRRFAIGDYVQWEPQGILQFQEAKQITSLSPDGLFAFVEGGGTGLPVDELTLQEKPAETRRTEKLPENRSMKQDVFSLTEGTITIQWPTPLSADSIQDIKDWLKIVERKITRATADVGEKEKNDAEEGQ